MNTLNNLTTKIIQASAMRREVAVLVMRFYNLIQSPGGFKPLFQGR